MTAVQQQPWLVAEAERLMGSMGTRWRHVGGVVNRAARVGWPLPVEERTWLLAAAYVHDIGSAPELVATGFHAIDGARWLRAHGHGRLADLVAHHTDARFEAELRGLGSEIADFEREDSPTADALTYCDLTTSPTGALVRVEERLAEIARRYEDGHVVRIAIDRATPSLWQTVRRVEARLASIGLLVLPEVRHLPA